MTVSAQSRGLHRLLRPSERPKVAALVVTALATISIAILGVTGVASAATAKVELGPATPFSVLAGSTVTNTGPTVLWGDLGLSPGTSVTGFPPGKLDPGGVQYVADGTASLAQGGSIAAYLNAQGRAGSTVVGSDIGGETLVPGVYSNASSLGITGTLTLNAEGNPNAVFIFQVGSTLKTAADNSTVALVGDAQACNVFWQVGSSATIGTYAHFAGTVLALASVTVNTGATVEGRALAQTGAVTLDDDVFVQPSCATTVAVTTTSKPTTTTSSGDGDASGSGSGSGTTPVTALSSSGTIPKGAPATGFGGSAQSNSQLLLVLGGVAALAGLAVAAESIRRNRKIAPPVRSNRHAE